MQMSGGKGERRQGEERRINYETRGEKKRGEEG